MDIDNEKQLVADIEMAFQEALRAGAEHLCMAVEKEFSTAGLTSRTGNYLKSISKESNQGQSWTNDRGQSFTVPTNSPVKTGSTSWEIEYGVYAPYAAYLEDGTKAGIKPHKVLEKATQRVLDDKSLEQAAQDGFNAYLARKGGS